MSRSRIKFNNHALGLSLNDFLSMYVFTQKKNVLFITFYRSLNRASEESSRQLTNLPSGYKLAVIFNINLVTNALAFRFGMFSDSCHKIWEKKEKSKKKGTDVPVSKRPEDDQLPELRKVAEMALSALEELQQTIMPRGCIDRRLFNADNVHGPKVRIEVFYKKVRDMKKLKYQITLENVLKATADFCRNLFTLSKQMEIYRADVIEFHARFFDHHEMLNTFLLLANQQLRDDEAMGKHINAQKQGHEEMKKEMEKNTVIANVAQYEVNQQMMKMTESYYNLQQAKKDIDAKYWDIHKV